MRLLNVAARELELKEFFGDKIAPYAILSHTWGDDEVTFQDLQHGRYEHKAGFRKIHYACRQAKQDGLSWCWVDTCCIDKASSAELSEAINSMFNWYPRADVCYAYLADVTRHTRIDPGEEFPDWNSTEGLEAEVTTKWHDFAYPVLSENARGLMPAGFLQATSSLVEGDIQRSRWFTRGWTLQELIAPHKLRFYNSSWIYLGNRDYELSDAVGECTGLGPHVLGNPKVWQDYSIARRMSWMANRETTRSEDRAYCLLGIFGVHMPLLYGEEDMAFTRLQQELARRFNDHSLFVHEVSSKYITRSVFATTPQMFAGSNMVNNNNPLFPSSPYSLTNVGLHISLPLLEVHPPQRRSSVRTTVAVLNCQTCESQIGLVLEATSSSLVYEDGNRGETMYRIARYVDASVEDCGITEETSLGPGVVSIPNEIAVAANIQKVLIEDVEPKIYYLTHRRDDEDRMLWVRYDTKIRYDSASSGLVSEHTVAKRADTMRHMIQLRCSRQTYHDVSVLKFLSMEEPSLAIIVIIPGFPPLSDHLSGWRAGLNVVEKDLAANPAPFKAIVTDLLDVDKQDRTYPKMTVANSLSTVYLMASTPFRQGEILELWYEAKVPVLAGTQGILTMRVQSVIAPFAKDLSRSLSDGFHGGSLLYGHWD